MINQQSHERFTESYELPNRPAQLQQRAEATQGWVAETPPTAVVEAEATREAISIVEKEAESVAVAVLATGALF